MGYSAYVLLQQHSWAGPKVGVETNPLLTKERGLAEVVSNTPYLRLSKSKELPCYQFLSPRMCLYAIGAYLYGPDTRTLSIATYNLLLNHSIMAFY